MAKLKVDVAGTKIPLTGPNGVGWLAVKALNTVVRNNPDGPTTVILERTGGFNADDAQKLRSEIPGATVEIYYEMY